MTREVMVFKIFHKILRSDNSTDFTAANEMAIKLGYLVPQELSYNWVRLMFESMKFNPNSTFYQEWSKLMSLTDLELIFDQLMHYASTYGTDFQGETWIPDRNVIGDFNFEQLEVLEGISEEELQVEVKKLASSSIALSDETIDFLVEEFKDIIDIKTVRNRQLKIRLIDENYEFVDGMECLNWILWRYFRIKQLVRSKETLAAIKVALHKDDIMTVKTCLEKNAMVLSQVFLRNKNVFIQFKAYPGLERPINHLRKLAKKTHQPMKKSVWLRISELSSTDREILFSTAPIFKLVQLYNAYTNPTGYYVIRNGKAFLTQSMDRIQTETLIEIKSQLLKAIIKKVPDVKSVALPKGITLAMPVSEKSFIGDLPIGSYIDCSDEHLLVGIYWRNEWGCVDLDLHARTLDGTSIGWNSGYRDEGHNILHSGDMTNADPEAAEVMYYGKVIPSILSVNEFHGDNSYEYDFFIAKESPMDSLYRNYMVDPTKIVYRTRLQFEATRDVTLGYIKDGKFVFHSCTIGKGIIPNNIRQDILEHLTKCQYLTINSVLEMAGIEVVDEEEAEVKLLSKGDLINFFS